MLCLRAGQCLGEHIRSHVVGWAVDELQRAIFDDELNEVISYVDVLGSGMEIAIGGDGEHRLVVAVKGCRFGKWRENFANETAKPDGLLGCVS